MDFFCGFPEENSPASLAGRLSCGTRLRCNELPSGLCREGKAVKLHKDGPRHMKESVDYYRQEGARPRRGIKMVIQLMAGCCSDV